MALAPFARAALAGHATIPLVLGALVAVATALSFNDDGRYRAAIQAGKPDQRRMFTAIDGDQVTWPDGSSEHVDTFLLATGYRPALSYLDAAELGHHKGISTVHQGLGYVGLEWQRSFASATLRGVGRDARHVVHRLLRHG